MKLEYHTIPSHLIMRAPELRIPYEREARSWLPDEMGVYTVFDAVAMPVVISALKSGLQAGFLRRFFDFVAEMSSSSDLAIQEVAAFGVCEPLHGKKMLLLAEPYMGQSTLRICEDVKRFWSNPELRRLARDDKT